MQALTLQKINGGVYRVMVGARDHVGNLKLIGGQWQFKAVGYGLAVVSHDVIPIKAKARSWRTVGSS